MPAEWVDIREPHTGKLLMRYSPRRRIIEVQRRGVKTVIDLEEYDAPVEPSPADEQWLWQAAKASA